MARIIKHTAPELAEHQNATDIQEKTLFFVFLKHIHFRSYLIYLHILCKAKKHVAQR